MDVRSCKSAGTTSREALVRRSECLIIAARALKSAPRGLAFLLTDDLHGCRLCGSEGLLDGFREFKSRRGSVDFAVLRSGWHLSASLSLFADDW